VEHTALGYLMWGMPFFIVLFFIDEITPGFTHQLKYCRRFSHYDTKIGQKIKHLLTSKVSMSALCDMMPELLSRQSLIAAKTVRPQT